MKTKKITLKANETLSVTTPNGNVTRIKVSDDGKYTFTNIKCWGGDIDNYKGARYMDMMSGKNTICGVDVHINQNERKIQRRSNILDDRNVDTIKYGRFGTRINIFNPKK